MTKRIFHRLLMLFALAATACAATDIEQVEVYTSKQDGYAIYRIPAIVPTTSGTLLAFAEGRKNSASDAGRIDLLVKRSTDDGKTWGPLKVVWSDGANTCGNPAPVVDVSTGRIWLLSTWNLATDHEPQIHDGTSTDTRRVFVMHSDDDGHAWSHADEITTSVKKANWRWYATGPVHGIQLRDGRLVIPANHSTRTQGKGTVTSSHAIFSDDHGATWNIGEPVGGHTNESTIAELSDGALYDNMRSYRGLKQRATAWSRDRGNTWTAPVNDPALVEPVCQGSVLRYLTDENLPIHLFSNPASTKRELMTVRVSRDDCRTWTSGTLIHRERAAYSDLCSLPDRMVGLLYERDVPGSKTSCITFARIPLDLLLQDTPTTSTKRTSPMETRITSASLPAIPDANGFAAPFAGRHAGALICAGGANFPGKKPWEGGKKVWHDSIFMLADGAQSWSSAGKLPQPIAYGVSVTTPDGILCVGGEGAERSYTDVFMMRRDGDTVTSSPLPALPAPRGNACGAMLGSQVFIMGGTARPGATAAEKSVYVLDLKSPNEGWREIEPWPGRPRMLAVASVANGALYLCSGVDLHAGSDGKPVRTYLNDAYRFEPGKGWEKIADMPRAAVAAASPAPAMESEFFIIGGDDGKLAGTPPGPDHPGFPRTMMSYDTANNVWTEQPVDFVTPVTLPCVPSTGGWILPNGEIRPGVRTPQVTALKITKEQAQ